MSFLYNYFFPKTYKKSQQMNSSGKEEDSAMTRPISPRFPRGMERTSSFTSRNGSVSIEMALVTPIFFFGLCCLCYLLEIMAIQNSVHAATQNVAKQIGEKLYATPYISTSEVEELLVKSIGEERINRSVIKEGSAGLDCSRTVVLPRSGTIRMHVAYEVLLPVRLFGTLSMSLQEALVAKGWTGYVKGNFTTQQEEIVYVSETGIVYHRDSHCTYLELSIQMANRTEIDAKRNESGETYKPCELCGRGNSSAVYITSHGNRYHSSLQCSGLKRTIYAVPLSEVVGKGACSKCGH